MKKEIVTQGETYFFSVNLKDYPNPPWESSMVLTNADNVYQIAGLGPNCVGIQHSFKAKPEETLEYGEGDYKYRITVTDGTDVYTGYTGYASVVLDPTVPGNSMSHVEKTLHALNQTIEGKATSDILTYSIRGRSIGRMSPEELLSWRDKYIKFFKEEQIAQDIENGNNIQRGVIRVRL